MRPNAAIWASDSLLYLGRANQTITETVRPLSDYRTIYLSIRVPGTRVLGSAHIQKGIQTRDTRTCLRAGWPSETASLALPRLGSPSGWDGAVYPSSRMPLLDWVGLVAFAGPAIKQGHFTDASPALPQPVTRPGSVEVGLVRGVLAERVIISTTLDPFLPLKALAAYSGISVRKLRDFLDNPAHPLQHYRVGGKVLVRRSEFDAWISAYRQQGRVGVEQIVNDVLRGL